MLHVSGRYWETQLAKIGRDYIGLYEKPGKDVVYIPFSHNGILKKIKYQYFVDQWVFVDIL